MKADMKEIQKLERMLGNFSKTALPYAMKDGANRAAFQTMRTAKADIAKDMILRNKFTQQSIRVDRAMDIRRPEAWVGSTADYMATQEFGGVKRKRGKIGVAIPTSESAGQGRSVPRTRIPMARNKLSRIVLSRRSRVAKTREQATVFAVQDAVTSGKREVYLSLGSGGQTKGIFRVKGGSRKFKRGWPKGATLTMLYDLSDTAVNVPRNPWLRPAVDKTLKIAPRLYLQALEFQAKRLKLL